METDIPEIQKKKKRYEDFQQEIKMPTDKNEQTSSHTAL